MSALLDDVCVCMPVRALTHFPVPASWGKGAISVAVLGGGSSRSQWDTGKGLSSVLGSPYDGQAMAGLPSSAVAVATAQLLSASRGMRQGFKRMRQGFKKSCPRLALGIWCRGRQEGSSACLWGVSRAQLPPALLNQLLSALTTPREVYNCVSFGS